MARYKAIDTSPRFLAVDLTKQLLPGSFEYAVHLLLEREFDLGIFDTRYRNDRNGASAYPPGMLLKVILCAYAQGVVSSRGIERLEKRGHTTNLCGAPSVKRRNGPCSDFPFGLMSAADTRPFLPDALGKSLRPGRAGRPGVPWRRRGAARGPGRAVCGRRVPNGGACRG